MMVANTLVNKLVIVVLDIKRVLYDSFYKFNR
jgi:hypothetical protein